MTSVHRRVTVSLIDYKLRPEYLNFIVDYGCFYPTKEGKDEKMYSQGNCIFRFFFFEGGFTSFRVSEFLSFRVTEFPSFQVSKFPREGGREDQ